MSGCFLERVTLIDPAFHDFDPMEVVWHGNYFKYFEIARTNLFQGIGYDYPAMKASGYSWPVVDCQCRFSRPIVYGRTIGVSACMVEYENRVVLKYAIRDVASGEKLCKGSTTQIAFDMKLKEACFITPEVFQQFVRDALVEKTP